VWICGAVCGGGGQGNHFDMLLTQMYWCVDCVK
jgi:hypothetical protein